MATKLLHKRGTSDPTASDLSVGEIGINTTDGGIFTKTTGGAVVEAGGGGGGGVNSDPQYNTVAGTNAGNSFSGSSPEYNSLYGYNAGTSNTTGDGGTAVGYQALETNDTGSYNTAVGYRAAQFNEGASSITAIGSEALRRNTSGEANVAVGAYALGYNTSASNNVAVGQQSLANSTGTANVAMGHQSGQTQTSGTRNVFIGYQAGHDNTTADDNTAVGYQALDKCTTGAKNVAIGPQALQGVIDHSGNTAVGYEAGKPHSGANNTIIGYQAGAVSNSGDNNIVIGKEAYTSTTSVSNEITLGNVNNNKFRIPGTKLESSVGVLGIKNSGNQSELRLYCESNNAHYAAIKAPPHAQFSGNPVFQLPPNGGTNGYFLKTDGSGNTSWSAVSATTELSTDTSPTLGGDLDMDGNSISSGILGIKNGGQQSELRLYCESNNAHYVAVKAPPHSQFSGNQTFQLPPNGGTNGYVLSTNGNGVTSWVAQSGGGGGTTYTAGTGLNLSGTAFSIAYGNSSSNAVRKITSSTSAPSGGSDGDIWIKYTN